MVTVQHEYTNTVYTGALSTLSGKRHAEKVVMHLMHDVYTGALSTLSGKRHAEKVVMHLMHDKLDVGHHIFMGNFYNDYELATKLLTRRTNCTGTLRKDRKNTPENVKKAKLTKGAAVANYAKGVMIGKWRDKREVYYISTEYENDMVEIENRRKQKVRKPKPIVQYNKYSSEGSDCEEDPGPSAVVRRRGASRGEGLDCATVVSKIWPTRSRAEL
ncbi:Transposase IS4 [Popillia japonica]|uniref:Transposase IS4 n=1 Tax=Popillia japonica TaxID=7064 RepID=A0AAW1JIX1_POPJA